MMKCVKSQRCSATTFGGKAGPLRRVVRPSLFAVFAVAVVAAGCPTTKSEPLPVVATKALGDTTFVNCGGPAFVDSDGNAWLADTNFNTGNAFSTNNAVAGAPDGQPYQTERWDSNTGQELMYSFPFAPGEYTVRLHFAEIYSGAANVGNRVFDVLIEGQVVLDNYDIVADVGYLTAVVKEFPVNLVDGTLNIQFLHVTENPKISGIEIIEGPVTFPELDASPASLDFGSVQVGNVSAGQTVTLTNTGTDVLNISGIAVQGANALDFTTDAAPSYTIDPGLSANFDVTFGPTGAGARSADLVITSDDANSPATIPLSGTGLSPVASVSPPSTDFGSVFTGDTSSATTVTITNDGNQTLNVSSISLGGVHPGDFGTNAAASYVIAPAGSETFDVTFSPTTGGARSAELSIVSDDPASPATVTLSGTGVVPQPPTADVSPVAMDFGTITVNNPSSAQSVMITNVGDQTLDVTGVSASGDFGTDAAPPYSIAPSSSVSFNVTFTPTQEGARAGQVDITSNDPASPATVLLSGQGQQPQPPTASLNPASHDFGTVTTSESGTPLVVTLGNIGDETLEVSSVGIGGANAGDFGTDALASYSIDPGNSVNFNVTFTPSAAGARVASLSVVSNDPNTPAVLSLSGTGQDPQPPNAAVTPLSLSFGSVTLPDSSAPLLVTITNDGELPLDVTNVSLSGANPGDFGTDALASYAIDPGNSVNFNVTFTPSAGGARTANLVIDSNDPDGSVVVPLDGTGVEPPKASVTPTPHDFGQEFVGNTTAAQTFTVENIDTESHDLTGVSLTGADSGDFVLSATPALPLTMNASDTATADVAFAPTDVGGRSAQLVFEFDSGAFSVVADLSGTGADSIPVAFYRVNTGGNAYVDGNGDTWVVDNPYRNTGSGYSNTVAIAGTTEDTLYQSERWDGTNAPELMYTFPVDPGEYTVRLHFAEIFSGNASVGARVFNVNVEGAPFLTNFDVFAAAGFATATTRETTVQVNDGNLNVEFIHVTENPKVSAIEILGNVTGVPVLSATPTNIDFGQVETGVESAPTTVTLNNIGNVELQVSGVQITNPVGGTFNHNALASYNIAPGASAAFDVTFTPDAQGAQSATLEIASNDGASPATIPLTGEGAAPPPDVSIAPGDVAFGSADIGSSTASTTVTITNNGGVSHTLESVAVGGANSGDFLLSASPATPLVLNPGESASADVAFAPSATGARAGQLTFSLDGGAITPTASLSGTGQNPPPPPPSGQVAYRINVGGNTYVDTLGNTWEADQGFNTGSSFSTTNAIAGTEDDVLYQTERWDNSNTPEMMWSLPVANGTYDVRLHFAEIFNGITAAGQRVFSINIEGQPAVTNYDIYASVGYLTADVLSIPATVSDGTLNIELIHVTENPKLSAIEVIVSGGLESDVALMEWGHVGVGATGDVKNVTLTNTGDVDATISSLAFNITAGVGHDFHATLGGATYAGTHVDISYPVNVVVPVGQSVVVPVQFLPTEEVDNDVDLVFGGNFGAVTVRLVGTGGEEGGHPFLHVVIVTDPYVVDFDGNGSEPVELIGEFSHTHEIGHALTAFEWTENGNPFATTANVSTPFPVGDHTVTLTIYDDNVPPEMLSGSETFSVVAPDAIPGVLAQYYTAGGAGGANVYLDAVPANAEFAETLPNGYEVLAQGGNIGGSPFSAFVMVQLLGRIQIDTAGDYFFLANGGNESRVFVDGALHTAAETLAPGLYGVEARFAVDDVNELPLTLTYAVDGGAQMPIDPLMIVHDEASMKPVINSMPSSGLASGGAVIDIDGLGFIPTDQVTVHWGATDISGASLAVTPSRITLTTPPGVNTIQVTVETPNGVSNPMSYTYNATGPAPIQFNISDMVTGLTGGPTAAAIGADGRLYVAELDGTIYAYTFDDNYNVTDTQIITTFENVYNFHILGLEVNPFDPPGVVRLYVAHNQLFAQGGACFTGVMPYSGEVSVITGPDFDTIETIATNLPVSNHDHGVGGMAFDDNGYLYVCSPGVTNAGVFGCNMGGMDASPLTGAILRLNLPLPDYNGVVAYRDPYTCIENYDAVFGESVVVDYGVDIDVYAPGLRNTMDIEYTTQGRLYATDNGPNAGFGPASTGPDTQDPDPTVGDELNLIDVGRYYGHPNRNIQRAAEDPRQYIYRMRGVPSIPGEYENVVTEFNASTNGIIEYRSQTFNDAMRGDLFAQRWNATTERMEMAPDGKSTTNKYHIFNDMTGLNIIGAPGGVIICADYTSGTVIKAVPNDITATGLTVFDIFPWRAPATGGHEFVIGGANFGNTGNTSVTIGGKAATVTSVTPKRITGIIPSSSVGAGPDMLDVVVTVGTSSVTMPSAFRYLRAPGEDSGSRATMNVLPANPNMNEASTYDFGSFNLMNESTNGQKITRMRIDLENAIMPDSVFDPFGVAGDPVGKDFTLDNGNVGVTGYTWFSPNAGGYNALEVTFDDFDAGETLRFSTDIDPTSVKGAAQPGPNHSASISGFDLTGAHFRVEFDDGTALEGTLFRSPGSDTGAQGTALAASIAPPEAEIEAVGLCNLSTTTNANQTIEVRGPAGYDVRLLVVESALYLAGVPGGGFDIDPFEYNTALSIVEETATIGGGGTVQIPVTLTQTDPDGGYNVIIAVLVDAQGNEGPVSDTLVLQLL